MKRAMLFRSARHIRSIEGSKIMLSRIALLALNLCLAGSVPGARAQDKTTPKGEKQPPTLEQRLALLEEQAARMLAEIKAIRGEVKKEAAAQNDLGNISIYRLKNVQATEMAKLLTELFSINRDNKSLRIVADAATNTVLVSGKREDQDAISAIIIRLDDVAVDAAPPKKERK